MESLQETKLNTFDFQYKNPHEYKFPEGKVKVVDILPIKFSDSTPIMLAPGWSENPSAYKDSIKLMSGEGRRVLSVRYPWRVSKAEDSGFPQVELQKAKLLLDVLHAKGIRRADVIAHSEGAINALIAAMIEPSMFRNITLDKPAGLSGKGSKIGLINRFLSLMKQETKLRPWLSTDPNAALASGLRVAHYIAGNPLKVLKELDTMTSFDIKELIQDLREKGIMFSVIAGIDDPLFPVREQLKALQEKFETRDKTPLEGFYSVRDPDLRYDLGHNALSLRPEKHTALALNALDNLQWKRERIEGK